MDQVDGGFFRPDDYFEVSSEYFDPGKSYFRPAAADDGTVVFPDDVLKRAINPRSYIPYTNDEFGLGEELRAAVVDILEAEGEKELSLSSITIAPSITSACINLIFYLRSREINRVLLETPCYYGTKFQLASVGFDTKLIPTFASEGFQIPKRYHRQVQCVYWVTQPRISIGIDQVTSRLLELCAWLDEYDSLLVVDEATELKTPPLFARKEFDAFRNRIIRLKSLFKPLAINGQRFAFMIHPPRMAEALKKFVWIAHGGIDRFSSEHVFWARENVGEYNRLKAATLAQCTETALQLQRSLRNSPISLPDYENGYTTAFHLPLSALSGRVPGNERQELICICERLGVFPTLGASMYFADEAGNEQIRINLLSDKDQLIQFASALSAALR